MIFDLSNSLYWNIFRTSNEERGFFYFQFIRFRAPWLIWRENFLSPIFCMNLYSRLHIYEGLMKKVPVSALKYHF